jgi:hypothetical protein
MGNGNIFDYAEVVIETCTGDVRKVQFDRPSFREARAEANQALATLSMIGMGGKTLGQYQTGDMENWFSEFPDWSHLMRVQVNKMNHHSDKVRPFAEREYTCEHTQEPA